MGGITMRYLQIGEETTLDNGVKVRCEKAQKGCYGCVFDEPLEECHKVVCLAQDRPDKTDVIFKKVE